MGCFLKQGTKKHILIVSAEPTEIESIFIDLGENPDANSHLTVSKNVSVPLKACCIETQRTFSFLLF